MRGLRVLAPAALLVALACQPKGPAPVYGPWEEGLTLAYEDPTLPPAERSAKRLQVRVGQSALEPGGPRRVDLQLTTLQGHLEIAVRHQNGGIALVDPAGKPLSQLLPEGFPATAAWTDRGTPAQVLGRATWDGAALLPGTSDPVGVWVEFRPAAGPRRRTLYLPNLGEVETLEERQGAWTCVNRLVSRGFTDTPSLIRH